MVLMVDVCPRVLETNVLCNDRNICSDKNINFNNLISRVCHFAWKRFREKVIRAHNCPYQRTADFLMAAIFTIKGFKSFGELYSPSLTICQEVAIINWSSSWNVNRRINLFINCCINFSLNLNINCSINLRMNCIIN